MSDEKKCAQCGAPLLTGAPEGLCPACLLKRALETQTAAGAPIADFTPPSPEELARHFPQLEILELLGRGGMGVVYKARQRELDRMVALKILPSATDRDPAFAERFAREARALARLSHPNIVAVYDFGQTSGLFYFVMEYVDGLNLRQLLSAAKITPQEALAIVPQICEALQTAHDQGIVHRDIKPANILLDKKGRVKIADFGIAKILGGDERDMTLTGAGEVMGTPAYMAPEQIEHPLEVDHRADIYSLGVVFYQMLTGELPLGKFAPPSSRVRGVRIDVRLDDVVLRALEKEPELRYQQASEVKTQVETIAGSQATPDAATKDVAVCEPEVNPWQSVIALLAIVICLPAFIIGLVIPFPVNIVPLVLAPIGLIVAALKLAGLWPFPSPMFSRSNWTGRNLQRNKLTANPVSAAGFKPNTAIWIVVLAAVLAGIGGGLATLMLVGKFDHRRHQALQSSEDALLNSHAIRNQNLAPSEQVLTEYDWAGLAAKGQLLGGTPVQVDGRSALKIENTTDAPLRLSLLKIEKPPVTSMHYAVTGEIEYKDVHGPGYLEMWNDFPEGNCFSRTLGDSGPMGRIAGTANWRTFSLPFDRTGTANPPTRLEFNIFLAGRGVVFIGPLKLIQLMESKQISDTGGATKAASQPNASVASAENPIVAAAGKWLALIDDGNYPQSWEEASAIFHAGVTKASWQNSMETFRKPLGNLVSRKVQSVQHFTELPGAPDGQYTVMQFNTSFTGKKSAIETVTFMLEKDGTWRSAGYFIK